jgi:hypothetical protein
MGILDRIRRTNKVQEAEDMATPSYANTAVNNITAPKGPGERSDRRELGTDIYLLEATEAISVIKSLAYATTTRRKFRGEYPNLQLDSEETISIGKPWAQAILIYLDTIWPTIWMTPYEADTKKLMLRTAFYEIRKSMSFQDKQTYGAVVRACMNLCIARMEDCKDGHKDMIVKIDTHKLEVSTNRSVTQNAKN